MWSNKEREVMALTNELQLRGVPGAVASYNQQRLKKLSRMDPSLSFLTLK